MAGEDAATVESLQELAAAAGVHLSADLTASVLHLLRLQVVPTAVLQVGSS